MPITVNSPFSGKPVKIRDQDVGRAVRDEENRIFYVLARSDGEGFYSAPTRKGGEKEQQRYIEMLGKTAQAREAAQSAQQVHDARGRGRSGRRGRLLLVLLVLIVIAGAAAYHYRDRLPWNEAPSNNGENPPTEVDDGAP